MMPSDLGDFARYGGLYRHVHLVYVPAVSIERVRVDSTVNGGKATVEVKPRLYNPANALVTGPVSVRVTDPSGKVVATSAKFTLDSPALWSPKYPTSTPSNSAPRRSPSASASAGSISRSTACFT